MTFALLINGLERPVFLFEYKFAEFECQCIRAGSIKKKYDFCALNIAVISFCYYFSGVIIDLKFGCGRTVRRNGIANVIYGG